MKIISILILVLNAPVVLAQKQTRMIVNFDFNAFVVTAATATGLDSLVAAIPVKKQGVTIELYGHCDSIGSNEYNDELSKKRVGAIKNYLSDKGLESAIIVKEEGLGKRQPLQNNSNDMARLLNRRVELVITIPSERLLTKAIEDTATKAGTKIPLNNLNYYGGSYELLPESKPILIELLSIMRKYPALVIAIEGHICCVAGANEGERPDLSKNLTLSGARAQVVYNYLIQNGVAANRLSYIGYEHRFPIYPYPEKTEEEREANRRVEIRIVKK